ncbi:hypothetical protein CC85DRAFT_287806 [Cutaneotrichosporon oleaginosum]|uniref:SUR7-domain-containing protein n=1 Tax=Cutaneotrichosporon oleaginosum TaxID=879819 RepID=A0A0J0XGF2_9TREE|nr:uncharacterized protein CC85DRAFT_287806 [Cutaneotrichosporon oleaginosum]KLT40180.1 hypothetical protein CC85DRAFT_287806 [Cutaneotrichosporon oleaginosum]TXT06855.1 hypothetical protein COLE_06186 [Cutaneotrichosporon oleaginosum]
MTSDSLRGSTTSLFLACLTFAALVLFFTLNLATPIGDFSLMFVNLGPQDEWRASFGIYGACYKDALKGKVCTDRGMGWKIESKLFEDLEVVGIKVPSLVSILTKGLFFVPLTTVLIAITLMFWTFTVVQRQKRWGITTYVFLVVSWCSSAFALGFNYGLYRAIRLAVKVSGPDMLHAHAGPGMALTLCGFLLLLVAMCFGACSLCAPTQRYKNEYPMGGVYVPVTPGNAQPHQSMYPAY